MRGDKKNKSWLNSSDCSTPPSLLLTLSLLSPFHHSVSLSSYFIWSLPPLFQRILSSSPHVWVWQHSLPCWKLTQLQGFHFGGWRMRAMQRGRSGWQEEPFNRCVFHVALSQPLSRAIDEGGSLWLHQGLKAPVREAWEPSSYQTLLHIKQPDRAALCSPTVSKVERSFDRETLHVGEGR